jgi:hypothetical protein
VHTLFSNSTPGSTGQIKDVAPLLALEPLANHGLTHLKLSGFALTAQHIQVDLRI